MPGGRDLYQYVNRTGTKSLLLVFRQDASSQSIIFKFRLELEAAQKKR
jgi:hypothetical protein